MEQPRGFVAQGESSLVCISRKSLYGLKQSPRAWFRRFSAVVKEFCMRQSEADHSVFYRILGTQCSYLIVYVDDIVITCNDHEGIRQLKRSPVQALSDQRYGQSQILLRYQGCKVQGWDFNIPKKVCSGYSGGSSSIRLQTS